MASVPKKVSERLIKTIGSFQRILQTAKNRDINEADTVRIINDMLADVFGFDKYTEITSEYVIRGTYCDLAIKIDGNLKYLMEVKAIGLDLKESHLRQAVNYGASQGIPWVVLTNGIDWEIHRIRFEKPLDFDLICKFNFLDLNPRKREDQERIFLLCREGISKDAIEEFREYVENINKFVIGSIIQSDAVLDVIRRELRKMSPGVKVDKENIEKIIVNDVLKRDIVEGDSADKAKVRLKKALAKAVKKQQQQKTSKDVTTTETLH